MRSLVKGFMNVLGFCFLLGGVLGILQLLGIGNFKPIQQENTILSIVVVIAALVFGVALLFLASRIKILSNDEVFEEAINQIKADGYKITYANRSTGTISYKDGNNEIRSISVYKGYNSHKK